jgi:hypothetical protein
MFIKTAPHSPPAFTREGLPVVIWRVELLGLGLLLACSGGQRTQVAIVTQAEWETSHSPNTIHYEEVMLVAPSSIVPTALQVGVVTNSIWPTANPVQNVYVGRPPIVRASTQPDMVQPIQIKAHLKCSSMYFDFRILHELFCTELNTYTYFDK